MMAVPIMLNIDVILHLWLGDSVPEHTSAFVILILLTSFMNNFNAPLSNVVYATGKMRNYEVTFSLLNLLIIPISYLSLKLGAPAESVFVVYFIMTIFVQVACLLVLKTLVTISLRQYIKQLIIPLVVVAFVVCLIAFLSNMLMEEGFVRFILDVLVVGLVSAPLFYYISLDAAEKIIVNSIIRKICRRK